MIIDKIEKVIEEEGKVKPKFDKESLKLLPGRYAEFPWYEATGLSRGRLDCEASLAPGGLRRWLVDQET